MSVEIKSIHKGNIGECYICDCIEYMQSLEDKTFDVGFFDPPWGHGYNGKKPMGINAQAYKEQIINYKDVFDPEWNLEWFQEASRVCKRLIVAMGWKFFNWWVANTNPRGYYFITFDNGQGSTKVCKHNGVHPFMCYGDAFKQWDNKFHRNYLHTYIPNGFLRDDSNYKYIHPSPKPFRDWYKIIRALKPQSLFDAFAGTCTIGEVAETMNIPWRATEIDEQNKYVNDIKYRINRGMERYKKYGQTYQLKKEMKQVKLII